MRPFGFYIDFDPDGDGTYDDRSANGTCGTQTSCAADGSGDVFATAGTDFGARIAAVVWQGADDGNGDGLPDSNQALADNATTPNFGNESTAEAVDVTSTLVAPSGGSAGTFSGGAGLTGFSAGVLTVTDLRWSEVGILDLGAALADGDYLASGADVTGSAPNVGRFIPADFEVSVADAGMYALTCSGTFNYTGADFGYATGSEPRLTVTARNASATTTNYSDDLGGDFAKLEPAQVATTPPTQDASNTGISGSNLDVSATLATGTLTDNGDGTLTYAFASADSFRYDRVADARVAPFAADLPLDVDDVTDADGVTAPALPLTFTPSDPDAGGDVEIRFGRLVVDNTAGAEIAPLDMPVRAEHWDGDTWRDEYRRRAAPRWRSPPRCSCPMTPTRTVRSTATQADRRRSAAPPTSPAATSRSRRGRTRSPSPRRAPATPAGSSSRPCSRRARRTPTTCKATGTTTARSTTTPWAAPPSASTTATTPGSTCGGSRTTDPGARGA
ncbi:MAG: DUF6701 domain-containing protein [Halofilum sp. (in: g-proteobacteria)]|nr:DUF6701 domain-containing protein [Halofilum sp. (in: g-proteobacteria)]